MFAWLMNGRATKGEFRDTKDPYYDYNDRKTIYGAALNAGVDQFNIDEEAEDDEGLIMHLDGHEHIQNNDLNSGIQIGYALQ